MKWKLRTPGALLSFIFLRERFFSSANFHFHFSLDSQAKYEWLTLISFNQLHGQRTCALASPLFPSSRLLLLHPATATRMPNILPWQKRMNFNFGEFLKFHHHLSGWARFLKGDDMVIFIWPGQLSIMQCILTLHYHRPCGERVRAWVELTVKTESLWRCHVETSQRTLETLWTCWELVWNAT